MLNGLYFQGWGMIPDNSEFSVLKTSRYVYASVNTIFTSWIAYVPWSSHHIVLKLNTLHTVTVAVTAQWY